MDQFEPTLFTNTMYETANETVLFCQRVLSAHGHAGSASELEMYLPLADVARATMAREVLERLREKTSGVAREYIDIALNAVNRALRQVPSVVFVVDDAPFSAVA